MRNKKNNSFSIILCAYEPDVDFFTEQIESIINQSYKDWSLFIFDDSKSDKCHILFDFFMNKYGLKNKFFYFRGPQLTFSHNFLHALNNDNIKNDYVSNKTLELSKLESYYIDSISVNQLTKETQGVYNLLFKNENG